MIQQTHHIAVINMCFPVRNPYGVYLHSFTLAAHILLICFSLSACFRCCHTAVSRSFPTVHACDYTTDGRVRYQSSHLFWKLRVGAVSRCKNNVVTQSDVQQRLLPLIAYTQACRLCLLRVSVTCVVHCTNC